MPNPARITGQAASGGVGGMPTHQGGMLPDAHGAGAEERDNLSQHSHCARFLILPPNLREYVERDFKPSPCRQEGAHGHDCAARPLDS